MGSPKRSVLITGCSDGGMGSELAIAFHKAGLKVYATARNPAKMAKLVSLEGIETLELDVLSEASIAACAKKVPSLDILVNNAGQANPAAVSDMSIAEAKALYDINLWAPIAVIQGFLPLLLKSTSNPLIVNHTSVTSVAPIPFQAAYNSSKAALSMVTDTLRLELQPFGIQIVQLKTGAVKTNIGENAKKFVVPDGSIYEPAREALLSARETAFTGMGIPAEQWAREVAADLLRKTPAPALWRGGSATTGRVAALLPYGMFDNMLKKMTGLDRVEQIVRKLD
ncbi:NAD(P)-binding protein [Hypoxylon rubiginosum]|uniref:NAD(P)-binding protein n=1 Tax=Hypoxylon rubiginosum TaxID=110542 RepID=A0ACC0CTJ3_9PEZI|nr:NAD(P)-binding protein [Hypoxylon rubiginosum]